jgi:hypothetical protein
VWGSGCRPTSTPTRSSSTRCSSNCKLILRNIMIILENKVTFVLIVRVWPLGRDYRYRYPPKWVFYNTPLVILYEDDMMPFLLRWYQHFFGWYIFAGQTAAVSPRTPLCTAGVSRLAASRWLTAGGWTWPPF